MTDRPQTPEEMAALPIFGFGYFDYEVTQEDRDRGWIEIAGKRAPCPGTSHLRVPVMPDTKVSWLEPHEPMGYIDADGVMWRVGEYADGTFYRQRVGY